MNPRKQVRTMIAGEKETPEPAFTIIKTKP
jgi:hypothetical protein